MIELRKRFLSHEGFTWRQSGTYFGTWADKLNQAWGWVSHLAGMVGAGLNGATLQPILPGALGPDTLQPRRRRYSHNNTSKHTVTLFFFFSLLKENKSRSACSWLLLTLLRFITVGWISNFLLQLPAHASGQKPTGIVWRRGGNIWRGTLVSVTFKWTNHVGLRCGIGQTSVLRGSLRCRATFNI